MGYTNFPNGLTSFGIPLHGGANPILGTAYFVDGTSGGDGYTGLEVTKAFKTIQAAVTRQIANSTGRGDVIHIMPGTYAESVVASTLTDVQLIGAGVPGSVIIAPTTSHALLIGADAVITSTMLRSALKNITFKTPSTSSTNYAAVTIAVMVDSVIEDCRFLGTTTTGYELSANMTIGLQISSRTATSWEFHDRNRISRCLFTTQASRLQELGIGLLVGSTAAGTPAERGFGQSVIEDCIFACYDTAIRLRTGSGGCGGTILRRNTITSNQGGNGPDMGILSNSADGTDLLCIIDDNRVTAISDGISNFSSSNVRGNIVSIGGGAPGSETGQ